MRHTNSFQNLKNKKKNSLKNIEFFNTLSLRKKDCDSPNSNIQNFNLYSINEKNNSNKNSNRFSLKKNKNKKIKKSQNKGKENYNLSNFSTIPDKENKQINIRLNIKSEIINNNYSKKFESKKQIYEDIIQKKNYLISSLEKELSEIKDQINKIQEIKKKKNSTDDFENSNLNLKIRKINSNFNNEKKKIQQLKDSKLISKNVKHFLKNLILKKKESKSNSKKNSSKNIFSSKNLILNTSNYNNYIKGHKNHISSHLYCESTKEIEIDLERKCLKSNSRKNSSKISKSNSFLFTSNNFNNTKRNDNNRRSLSQFQTCNSNNSHNNNNYYNNSQNNNNNYNNSNYNNSLNTITELEKLKNRTKSLLSNYLKLCEEI